MGITGAGLPVVEPYRKKKARLGLQPPPVLRPLGPAPPDSCPVPKNVGFQQKRLGNGNQPPAGGTGGSTLGLRSVGQRQGRRVGSEGSRVGCDQAGSTPEGILLSDTGIASSDGMPMFSRHMEGDESSAMSDSSQQGAGKDGVTHHMSAHSLGRSASGSDRNGMGHVRREIGVTTRAMAELRITLQDTLQTAEVRKV